MISSTLSVSYIHYSVVVLVYHFYAVLIEPRGGLEI